MTGEDDGDLKIDDRKQVAIGFFRSRVRNLVKRGLSYEDIARSCGISVRELAEMLVDPGIEAVDKKLFSKLKDAHRPIGPNTRVDAGWLAQKVSKFHDMGLTYAYMSRVTGISGDTLSDCANARHDSVLASTVARFKSKVKHFNDVCMLTDDVRDMEVRKRAVKVCPACGRSFEALHNSMVFCSDECRRDYRNGTAKPWYVTATQSRVGRRW